MALLVARVMLLKRLPVITEDLLEGVFVDSLPCGCHSARLYHVLTAKASRLFTLLSPSRPIASPRRDGQNRGVGKRKFLYAQVQSVLSNFREGMGETHTRKVLKFFHIQVKVNTVLFRGILPLERC